MSKTFWLISISSENTEKSFAPGINFQGFDKKSRKKVDVMKPDDRLLYYINDKRVFIATSTITSKMFEKNMKKNIVVRKGTYFFPSGPIV